MEKPVKVEKGEWAGEISPFLATVSVMRSAEHIHVIYTRHPSIPKLLTWDAISVQLSPYGIHHLLYSSSTDGFSVLSCVRTSFPQVLLGAAQLWWGNERGGQLNCAQITLKTSLKGSNTLLSVVVAAFLTVKTSHLWVGHTPYSITY